MKVRIASAVWFLPGLIVCACLSIAQAQVFLPGEPGGTQPPVDVDPDLYNTLTESGDPKRPSGQLRCGNPTLVPPRLCHGGLLTRFANPEIDSDGNLAFDWQIKAAQPPEETDLGNFLTSGQLANLLGRLQLRLFINVDAFGTGSGNAANNWGPGCEVTAGVPLVTLAQTGGTVAYSSVQGAGDILQLQLANTQTLSQFTFAGPLLEALRNIVIPHDQYLQMARISCPVVDNSQPAKVAFTGFMMGTISQRIVTNAGTSGPLDIERYATIADNNLWYYPLDGNPAIVDAELGAGGVAYLDLMFSEPVTVADGSDAFSGDIAMGNRESTDMTVLTIDRVVPIASTVIRIHLSDDLQTVAGDLSAASVAGPYFVFVTPPATGITDGDSNTLHTGDDWRLAVFFDHQAPRIEEATVGANSASIELTFSEPVQFGVQFTGEPPVVSAYGTTEIPAPNARDFRIVLRGEDGASLGEPFSPESISYSGDTSVGLTSLTLEMPPSPANTDGEYFATQTVDVRIADRLKDLTHPSQASVFTFVNNIESASLTTVQLKTSKFGNDTGANFPRSAAFAQVGSLQLRGREYEIVADSASETVATGDTITLRFELVGAIPLKVGEQVEVGFILEGVGTLGLTPPSNIRFIGNGQNNPTVEVTWTPNPKALDAGRLPDAEVIVSPQVVEAGELLVTEGNASSATTVTVERVFHVEADPNERNIRGVDTEPMVLQISDRGAALVAGDSPLVLTFFLEEVQGASVASTQIGAFSADSHVSVVDLDGGLYNIEVTFTDVNSSASIDLAVTDAALPVINTLLLAQSNDDVRFVYEGDDETCRLDTNCVATVSAAGGRVFTLAFEPEAVTLERGGAPRVVGLVLSLAPGDSFNSDESVEVTFGSVPGLSIDPLRFTFDGNNARAAVVLSVNDDALDGAFTLEVNASVDQGAPNERNLIDLSESELPVLAGEVRPRAYEISAVRASESVATGDEVTLQFELDGLNPLLGGESVTVFFRVDSPDNLDLPPPSPITFDGREVLDVVWKPNPRALDAVQLAEAEVMVVASHVAERGDLSVAAGASTAVTVTIIRTFHVEAVPNALDIRGVSTETMALRISDRGAGLVAADGELGLRFSLEGVPPSPATVTSAQIRASSADSHVEILDLDGGLYDIQVGFTSANPTASIDLAVVDAALPVIDTVLIGAGPDDVRFVYTGGDRDCEGIEDCTASVSAAGGRTFTLAFDPADLLQPLEPGDSRSVDLVFAMAPGDSLNADESVGVTLAPVPGLTVSPSEFTFNTDSAQEEVTLTVLGNAPAGVFMLTVEATTVTQGTPDERMLINLAESQRPELVGEVYPRVSVISTSSLDGLLLSRFAPGAVLVTVTTPTGPLFIAVPGIGAETVVDTAALLESDYSPSLGVCVKRLERLDLLEESTPTISMGQADCDVLQPLAEDSRIRLAPYRSILYWVGIDADDNVATNSAGDVVLQGAPQAVYVAPPVGFVTGFWAYAASDANVTLPLEIGGVTALGMVGVTLETRLGEDVPVSSDVSFADITDGRFDLTLSAPPARSTDVSITMLNGFAFAGGQLRGAGDYNAAISDHELYSLGNDRITLLPQDEPLPQAAVEGRDDGPFLRNVPKTITLSGSDDVTIYRYSSETRVFVLLEQASSAREVVIDAAQGRVTIETLTSHLPTDTTTTELVYPTTDTPIFEIVVDAGAGASTPVRTIRLFGVDAIPTGVGAGVTVGDRLGGTGVETTLLNGDTIAVGPYFSAAGIVDFSAPVDAGLLPDLPDAVGDALDYIVNGDPTLAGGLASVSMQLSDSLETSGAFYHVYQRQPDGNGDWAPFLVDDRNRIFSAPEPCPAASASRQPITPEEGRTYAWELADEGLGEGHRCVLVETGDGGMNDADQTANTFVYNTGAFAAGFGFGRRHSGAMDLAWLLGLALIMLVGGQWHRRTRGVRLNRR